MDENALSPQELDLVNRSNKKVKRNTNGDAVTHDEDATLMEMEANMDKIPQQTPKVSFKDTFGQEQPQHGLFLVFQSYLECRR